MSRKLFPFPGHPHPLLQATILVLTFTFLTDVAFSFYCTQSYCDEVTAPYNTPCQPVPNCTKIGYRTFLDPDVCNCCPYCFDYLEEDDDCETTAHTKPIEMCGPHLECLDDPAASDTQRPTCQKMTTSRHECMERRARYEKGPRGVAEAYPECDSHGMYAPRQCLPGSICYCSDQYGNRAFGLATPQEYQDCACARDVSRLQEFGFKGRLPHCLPNGDYDELQCVVRTCFCRSHPEDLFAMHLLNDSKCYDPNIHIFEPETPRYYMRDCELRRARIEVQIADAEMEGKRRIVADTPKCDPDGNYSPVQSKINMLYCANPTTGLIIVDNTMRYEAEKFTEAADMMNCHCARVRDLLHNSVTGKPRCCSNGNYRPWQCVGTKCFCVDQMGRQDLNYPETNNDPRGLGCYPEVDPSNPDPNDGVEPLCDYEWIRENYYK